MAPIPKKPVSKKTPAKKPAPKKCKPRVKAGTSKVAAAERKIMFAKAFIANNGNKTQAAIAAGLSPNTAEASGRRMFGDVTVKALIAQHAKETAVIVGLDMQRTLREVARLAYADPRKLFDKDGKLIPIHLLDDDMAAAVASFEQDEITAGENVIGTTKKLKVWDKNAALEKAMKHHGLYKDDNDQRNPFADFTEEQLNAFIARKSTEVQAASK